MSNQIKLASKLFILIAVLLFAWVGISCKNENTPGEEGGMDLKKPNDVTNKVGDNDGFMNDDELNKAQWRDEMIQIRLLAVSEDGGYYRNPVIATFGNRNTKVITVMEKRFGQSGERDVAVDGNSRVDLIYQYSANSGYEFGKVYTIGQSAQGDASLSRGVPVVFANSKKEDEVVIVAVAGGGFYGKGVGSQIKIVRGNPAGSLSSAKWNDLTFESTALDKITNKNVTNDANKAILAYINQVMGGTPTKGNKSTFQANAFYLKSGIGATSDDIFALAIIALDVNTETHQNFGTLIIYSVDRGKTWNFGPYAKPITSGQSFSWHPYDSSSDYRESKAVLLDGNTVTVLATTMKSIQNSTQDTMGVFTGTYNQNSEMSGPTRTGIIGVAGGGAGGGFELAKSPKNNNDYYLLSLKGRNPEYTKEVTLYKTTKDMQKGVALGISYISGGGTVAVLGDGSILTMTEEAFALGSKTGELKFNIVQRRFTPSYIDARIEDGTGIINDKERYYNPSTGSEKLDYKF